MAPQDVWGRPEESVVPSGSRIEHVHQHLPGPVIEDVRIKVEKNSRSLNYEVTAVSGSVARTIQLIDEAVEELRQRFGA